MFAMFGTFAMFVKFDVEGAEVREHREGREHPEVRDVPERATFGNAVQLCHAWSLPPLSRARRRASSHFVAEVPASLPFHLTTFGLRAHVN